MHGKVVRITDNDITYVYSGETVEYVINKSEISKIIHSSGRVEHISDQALPAETRKKDEEDLSASPVDQAKLFGFIKLKLTKIQVSPRLRVSRQMALNPRPFTKLVFTMI